MARRDNKRDSDMRSSGSMQHRRAGARKLGALAFDNPVAAGGWLVMLLTGSLIIANATSFQTGPHPSPLLATRDVTSPQTLVKTTAILTAPLVRDVQVELRRLGFYEGLLDGLHGPATERAVRAYQRARALTDTGRIDEALLARLALDFGGADNDPAIPVPHAAPKVAEIVSEEAPTAPKGDGRVLQLQALLSDLGYGPIVIDGLFGEQTASAIRRFELDRGLPITGEIGERLFAELENMSGRKLGR